MRLFNMPYENGVILKGQNICLKCYQSLELLLYFGKGFRFFHKGNIGSVGQRASNLLPVKVGVLKKKSAALAIPAEVCASAFGLGLSMPGVKSFSRFDSQQL